MAWRHQIRIFDVIRWEELTSSAVGSYPKTIVELCNWNFELNVSFSDLPDLCHIPTFPLLFLIRQFAFNLSCLIIYCILWNTCYSTISLNVCLFVYVFSYSWFNLWWFYWLSIFLINIISMLLLASWLLPWRYLMIQLMKVNYLCITLYEIVIIWIYQVSIKNLTV